jgi:acetamidase/formamidase
VRFRVIPASDPFAGFVHRFGPVVETPEYWVPTGLDEDLREAMKKAVRASIAFLRGGYGMDDEHAYAYLSAATDFDISQVVDRVTGIHARIRKADFG